MAQRVLSERELNRALLARQLLLERGRSSLPKTLERIGGIQAQYAPSMYVGLWTRMEGFARDSLTRALERRTVVQGTLLRATIHLVSPRDWWVWSAAIREPRRKAYERAGPSSAQMKAAMRRVSKRLAEGPVERAELQELIGHGPQGTNRMSHWIDLVRVPPSGTWERRRADLFAAAEEWIGPDPKHDELEARAELVAAYLRGFGPSTRDDIASWAGLRPAQVDAALERLELRRFRNEEGKPLLDLPRLPLPDPETPAPPRLLPVWDATMLVHAKATGILPERYRPRIFNTKTPQAMATFIVDGAVAGSWRFDKDRIRIEPFHRLDRATRRALDEEAERLADFCR